MPHPPKDDQYLARLRSYYKEHRAFPSMARLAQVVGLSSPSSVFELVRRLTESGFLERTPDRRIAPGERFFARPLVGAVRAGLPEEAPHDSFDVVTIDDYLIDDPNRTVLVRVRGDSMRDAGLLDGDIAVVERAAPAAPGEMVVAIIDEALTVKFLARDKAGYFLRAANPDYADIRPSRSLELFGRVIGSFRRIAR